MQKFEIVFTTRAADRPVQALFTYAASRRAAATWADDWARRRGWQVTSVTPTRTQKQPVFSPSAREQARRP